MKVLHRHFLATVSYDAIQLRLRSMDRNLILYRIGKALGFVQ